MGKFLSFVEHLVIAVIWVGVICAAVYFGAPLAVAHINEAIVAVNAIPSYKSALKSDSATSSRDQTACAAEITRSRKTGQTIANLAKPDAQNAMVTSGDIRNIVQ